MTDPHGGVTHMVYDKNGNLLSLTDAKGGVTGYSYDSKDRLAGRTDPLGKVESYLYDKHDNLTQFTNRKDKVATVSYDALNRRIQADYGRSMQGETLSAPDATVTYGYDSGNRLTQVVDSQGGTVTRGYDGLNRLILETTGQGTVNYGYDNASRRSSMTVAGQPAVTYSYDNADRLTGLSRGSDSVGLSYDAAGRPATLTLPNGIVATYSYDVANQLTGLSYTQGSTVVGDLSYGYDAAGQRVQVGGSLARMALPSAVSSASYNALNQLTNWGGAAHSYDANGNLTSDGTNTYTWDSRNRLTGISGGTTASFVYDGLNRRTSKTVSGTATAFLYDGLNPVQELSGSTPTANLLAGFSLDQWFARTDATGTRSFLTDALGSTLALADASGTIQTQYAYEPYGKATQTDAASSNAFQFTGRESDNTGLAYFRARYYAPDKGRFIAEDPIGLVGGTNTYAYVEGNPVNAIDPLGLDLVFPGPVPLPMPMQNPPSPSCGPNTLPRWLPGYGDGQPGRNDRYGNPIHSQASSGPPLPTDLLGNNGKPGGRRMNSDLPGVNPTPQELYDKLTGGKGTTRPDGTQVGSNGVRLRPDKGDGPRIDIPANGSKPHETIHFPPGT